MPALLFEDILKFNPYHDPKTGRFASKGGSTKGFKGTLYHGSPATDIKEFDMSLAGKNTSSGEKLLFFTDSKQMAEDFSYERLEGSSKFFQRRGEKGRVYEVDVEMKKPLDFRNLSENDIKNILKLDAEGLLTKEIVQRLSEKNHQLLKGYLDLRAERLKELGYDGMIANTGKAGHDSLEYAVVDSKQAKIKKSIEVNKFNPYHDPKSGRFSSKGGAKIDVSLNTSVTDAYGGETFMTTTARHGDEVVGHLEYSEYKGVPYIKYIETNEKFRGQGVATKLLQDLQRQYPDKAIGFGMTTPDGTKLLDAITYKVENKQIKQEKKLLSKYKAELEVLQSKLDELYDIPNPTESQIQEATKIGDRWDDVYRKVQNYEKSLLEHKMLGDKEVERFVRLDDNITKFNPYHDPKSGRFTTGSGGSAWSAKLSEEKAKVLAMPDNEQAMYLMDYYESSGVDRFDEELLAAYNNGEVSTMVENYFKIMEANGDPTPKKPKSKQVTEDFELDVEDEYDGDWTEARKGYVQKLTGMSEAEATKTMDELETWFSNRWDKADTATLDKYVEKDHVYDGTMYRGMKFWSAQDLEAFMENVSEGAQIKMKKNASWSDSKEVAYRFAHKGDDSYNSVVIKCIKNRTSAPVDHLSTQGEGEILSHSNAKWTVLRSDVYEMPNGVKKVFLTVVEAGE